MIKIIWIYPVISNADLGVFEGIGCSEFDATSQFSDVPEVRGCHLVNFHHHVLTSFHLLFSHYLCPWKVDEGGLAWMGEA